MNTTYEESLLEYFRKTNEISNTLMEAFTGGGGEIDLIIKPTEKCNFKCTFCSSTKISSDSSAIVELETIYRFLKRYPDTNTIIINGGDPLMMKPSYYSELIEHLDHNGYRATISFTSNLYPFYQKPDKWLDILRHERVGVATSFQYGNARLKHDLSPYTESEFWDVSDKFLELVGYRPSFIAVITDENRGSELKTVQLAKEMGVVAKVNYANGTGEVVEYKGITLGNKDNPYLMPKIYEAYLDIYEAGLMDWEWNTQQMVSKFNELNTTCPLNRQCDSGIRALQPAGGYYSCGSFGDSGEYPIDFEYEMDGGFATPLQDDPELLSLKNSCFECPMFDICNGCKKNTHEMKITGNVEAHCKGMKEVAKRAYALGILKSEPTEYVFENENFDHLVNKRYQNTKPFEIIAKG